MRKSKLLVAQKAIKSAATVILCMILAPAMFVPAAAAGDAYLEVPRVEVDAMGAEPRFNQGRPFVVSVNRSFSGGSTLVPAIADSLRKSGTLGKVVLHPYDGKRTARMEVKIGNAVPLDVATAVVKALAEMSIEEQIAISSTIDAGGLGNTHRIYIGSLVPTSAPTIDPERLQKLSDSPALLRDYLAQHRPAATP